MKDKPGTSSIALHPSILHAMDVIDLYWWHEFGTHSTVTSIRDSAHSERSYHYGIRGDIRERAVDVRIRDLDGAQRAKARLDLSKMLGTVFDVVLEEDHLHVELDVKEWLG